MQKTMEDGERREPFVEVGREAERVVETSNQTADETIREALGEAALTLFQARHEAERITEDAAKMARETIEVLLLTAEAQRTEMLDEQTRRSKLVREYDKELREQITVLRHELAKLKGETPALVKEADEVDWEGAAEEDASIWTDSEITGKSPRPVPIDDIGALGG
jgi:superfamily II DNA helicase RecQ